MARNEGLRLRYKGSANNAIKKWTDAIEKQLKDYEGELVSKLERVLDVVERVSQQNIPKDTTDAMKSFYREVVVEDGKIVAKAGYDKEGELPYIVYIHEIQYGNYTTPGTGPYFLSKGFEQASLEINKILSE